MADSPTTQIWMGRAVFVALSIVIIFVQLLPLQTMPRGIGFPDAMLGVVLTCAARRPDYVPALLIAAVFLLADLLFQRPPGLWTALVLILTEMLRARAPSLRSMPFPFEWATVAAGIVGIAVTYYAILTILMVPQAPFSLTLTQTVLTILFYPVVVGLSHAVFGVSRPAAGAVDSRGHRI